MKITNAWVFVSDPGSAQVDIFTLPNLKLIEIVTGLTQPQGECSDASGDVWVADAAAMMVDELEHSGKIVKHVADTYGTPISCAWDPKTGNLAVFNFLGKSSRGGAVLVYHHGAGVPNIYYNPKELNYEFGGYDAAGNLFFDGLTGAGKFMLSELPANASQAKTVSVSGGKLYTPGMVQWDVSAHDLVVGDQNCAGAVGSCIYRMSITKGAAMVVGKTILEDSAGVQVCDMVQGVLWNKSIVGSDFDFCRSIPSATYVWPYPNGGSPHATVARGIVQPFGTAISVRPKGDVR